MAKANGLDAATNGKNTLMPCLFALAKHGQETVDKWTEKNVQSLFQYQCHSETSKDETKCVKVEHGFTGKAIETLDILNNVPNLVSFKFPGKEKTGLYLSPKTCSYPVDDWQTGHISLFDALDDKLHSHSIICFGQNNFYVAFRNQEPQQTGTNSRKSAGNESPKVYLFDGDSQHGTNLTSHKDEKEMRLYIKNLLKTHNQNSQQNVQIRMCAHHLSHRYHVRKGIVTGQPMPSFPVPRFKTEPLLVIVLDTLVNKKCTMVDVKSTQLHSVVTANEKLESTQKLKAIRLGKHPYNLKTLPAPIRQAPVTTKSPSVPIVPPTKIVSQSVVAVQKEPMQTTVFIASKQGLTEVLPNDVSSEKTSNQQVSSNSNKKAQKQTKKTAGQKEKNIKTSPHTANKKSNVDAAVTKSASVTSKAVPIAPKSVVSKTVPVVSKTVPIAPKSVASKTVPVVLVENICTVSPVKVSSSTEDNGGMSFVISDVKSLSKVKVSDRGRKTPSPQPSEGARLTRSMRRSLQPQENNEVKALKASTAVQRRSISTEGAAQDKSAVSKNKGKAPAATSDAHATEIISSAANFEMISSVTKPNNRDVIVTCSKIATTTTPAATAATAEALPTDVEMENVQLQIEPPPDVMTQTNKTIEIVPEKNMDKEAVSADEMSDYMSMDDEGSCTDTETNSCTQDNQRTLVTTSANSKSAPPQKKTISTQSQEVLDRWLYQNRQNLYPGRDEKMKLMREANLTSMQVSRWLQKVRYDQLEEQLSSGNSSPAHKDPLKLPKVNFKKLQAVCKDVQANKSNKRRSAAKSSPSLPLDVSQVQTLTTQNAPQILSAGTAVQSAQFPMQIVVPVNTFLVQGQTGAVAMQPQLLPVMQPVTMVTGNDVVMQSVVVQNGMAELSNNMVEALVVNQAYDSSLPVTPIVIMPENSDNDVRPPSRNPSPMMSSQIELSDNGANSAQRTSDMEVTTNGAVSAQTTTDSMDYSQEQQILSSDTDLYGSPGVAFSAKKTSGTCETKSQPRKDSKNVLEKITPNTTSNASTIETQVIDGDSLRANRKKAEQSSAQPTKQLPPSVLMAKDSAPVFGDVSSTDDSASIRSSTEDIAIPTAPISTVSDTDKSAEKLPQRRSSARVAKSKKRPREDDKDKEENVTDTKENDSSKKRRLDELSETEMDKSMSDSETDDLDQIPEAAAQVITVWFKEHQGSNFRCPTLKERLILASETKLPLTNITKWFYSVRKEMYRQLRLGDHGETIDTSVLEEDMMTNKEPTPRSPNKTHDSPTPKTSSTESAPFCAICFRKENVTEENKVHSCQCCKEYLKSVLEKRLVRCKYNSRTNALCNNIFNEDERSRCRYCFMMRCKQAGMLPSDETQEPNVSEQQQKGPGPRGVPASGYAYPPGVPIPPEVTNAGSQSSSNQKQAASTSTLTQPRRSSTSKTSKLPNGGDSEMSDANTTGNSSEITIESDGDHSVSKDGNTTIPDIIYDQSGGSMLSYIQPISIEPMEEDTGSETSSVTSESNGSASGSKSARSQAAINRTKFTDIQLKTLEAEYKVNPMSAKMPLIAKALGVPLSAIKNWFHNRRSQAKRDEIQQKKRLELFTCRVCGQECFSENRYVNHYQMAHNTKVIITQYQDKETGETRTKAEYIIEAQNDSVNALQASGCDVRIEAVKPTTHKQNTEEVKPNTEVVKTGVKLSSVGRRASLRGKAQQSAQNEEAEKTVEEPKTKNTAGKKSKKKAAATVSKTASSEDQRVESPGVESARLETQENETNRMTGSSKISAAMEVDVDCEKPSNTAETEEKSMKTNCKSDTVKMNEKADTLKTDNKSDTVKTDQKFKNTSKLASDLDTQKVNKKNNPMEIEGETNVVGDVKKSDEIQEKISENPTNGKNNTDEAKSVDEKLESKEDSIKQSTSSSTQVAPTCTSNTAEVQKSACVEKLDSEKQNGLKQTDMNDNRNVCAERRSSEQKAARADSPAQKPDRLAQLYEMLAMKRKQKQQQK